MPRIEASERDISIIQRIYDYCCDIATTHAEFGRSKERFMMTRTYHFEIAWETATTVIDELTAFCNGILS